MGERRGGRSRLHRAQAQVQRVGEQVIVIVVGVRVAAVFGRPGRRVQHAGGGGCVEMRMEPETGKVFLEQRVGRGRMHVLLLLLLLYVFAAGVLDQIRELYGRV